jgi:hypothetical protein
MTKRVDLTPTLVPTLDRARPKTGLGFGLESSRNQEPIVLDTDEPFDRARDGDVSYNTIMYTFMAYLILRASHTLTPMAATPAQNFIANETVLHGTRYKEYDSASRLHATPAANPTHHSRSGSDTYSTRWRMTRKAP